MATSRQQYGGLRKSFVVSVEKLLQNRNAKIRRKIRPCCGHCHWTRHWVIILTTAVYKCSKPLLGGIALAAQVIPPIPAHFSEAWSVCLSSVTCVHPAHTVQRIYTPFDRYTCGVKWNIVLDGGPWDPRKKVSGWTASQNTQFSNCSQTVSLADKIHLGNTNNELDGLGMAIPLVVKLLWCLLTGDIRQYSPVCLCALLAWLKLAWLIYLYGCIIHLVSVLILWWCTCCQPVPRCLPFSAQNSSLLRVLSFLASLPFCLTDGTHGSPTSSCLSSLWRLLTSAKWQRLSQLGRLSLTY